MKSHNYVISLLSATQRREHISKEFDSLLIPFCFFDAISPTEYSEYEINMLIQELIPNLAYVHHLSSGEKGCLLSHLALWKKCLDQGYPYISIFEDDIILSPEANKFLSTYEWIDSTLKNQTFILRFETFLMPIKVKKTNIPDVYERKVLRTVSKHFGTAGYMLNKKSVEYLLSRIYNLKEKEIAPIDELIFNRFISDDNISIYQISPAPIIQELQLKKDNSKLHSQLEKERFHKENKKKYRNNRIIHKIYREITRPLKQIVNLAITKINKKIIKFR
ncbi:glycosyltransferase family 25 protein [Avibacterium paragallinarum]|uniref:Lipooligosaccharide biosynthesis protein lex-1 n=1 Tax=Avibacterium paragallinarum TaxID=728 RepID=A0A380X4V3_AVIPA|nr:glycosyltransferase family 25 protein [Avibacterium paragallinarum]SUU97707.1 Lipooligosaccharide biosynthesis protein lex-1 [Avibacterium paragallinarum]